MPELPEVETIRRGLVKLIVGKRTSGVRVIEKKSFVGDVREVEGRRVVGVRRRGKALLIECEAETGSSEKGEDIARRKPARLSGVSGPAKTLSPEKKSETNLFFGGPPAPCHPKTALRGLPVSGLGETAKLDGSIGQFHDTITLMVHLRMTGQLIYVGEERFAGGHPNEGFVDELPNRQTRVVIEFGEEGLQGQSLQQGLSLQGRLFFNDQRKFGFIKVIRGEDEFLRRLGPEPWDESLDGGGFYKRLTKHPGMMIKGALLDQSVIVGVGNIYADEALYFAKVHPMRRVSNLSRAEAERILRGVRGSMEKAIETGGSSLKNYVKADGTRGDYLEKFAKVFGRTGEECSRCGTKIQKIRVVGRGTHICPKCQKETE